MTFGQAAGRCFGYGAVILYVVGCVVFGSFNPQDWDKLARAFGAFMWLVGASACTASLIDFERN